MITGLNHITLAVSDVKISTAFYTELLGFKGHVIWDKGAYLSVGDLWLCLSLDPPGENIDYTHVAFTVDADKFNGFSEQLINAGVKVWKENISEGDSLYFLDPDGHKLEIHCGDLSSRVAGLQVKPYAGMKFL